MADPPSSAFYPATPDVGVTLGGKYRVLRRIGEGGMGVVVEAENLVTGKRVAIKWMHPQVAARPEAAERFLREARASARVRHPNVVDVYDAVHEGNTCFLVMELLEGEPLTYVLERGGMPAHELIAVLLDAMRGVAAAHRQGVIHRDIKPDNIFLAQEGDGARIPKVLDFGISKVTGSDALSLTRTGATMGTPMYMSFEQICGVKDIDARTDVYAFGVILYEALTGQTPFQAESFPELIVKITNTQPFPPKQLRPDIPRSLDRLVQRAMSKERETRVESLDVLIRELTPFATAASFRAQMTADDISLPRVVARSDEPPKPPEPSREPLVVEGRESAPIATPMEANVPVPAAPRRRDALPWLVVGGGIAAMLGALSFWKTPTEAPVEGLRPAAVAPGIPDPPPTAADAPAAAPLAPAPSAPSSPAGVPSGVGTPKATRPPHVPSTPGPPSVPNTASAEAERAKKAAEAAATAAKLAEAKRRAAAARSGAAPVAEPPSAAGAHTPPSKVTPAPAPAADPNKFRAGRPRSQDF